MNEPTTHEPAPASSNRVKSILRLSTGTVGGAAAMLLLNIVLGSDAPWFIERLSAQMRGLGKLTFDVNALKSGKFDDVDANAFHVNRRAGFYIAKPTEQAWTIATHNPGILPEDVTLQTVPFMKFSMQALLGAFKRAQPNRDDAELTVIASPQRQHSLSFEKDTVIDGLPMSYNPGDDPDLVDRVLEVQRGQMKQAGLGDEFIEAKIKELHDDPEFRGGLKTQIAATIETNWPKPVLVADGVAVLSLKRDAIVRSLGVPSSLQGVVKGTHLLELLQQVSILTGNPFWMNGLKRFEMSRSNEVMLAEGASQITNVAVGGKRHGDIRIQRILLLVLDANFVHIVLGRFIDGVTGSHDAAEVIENTLQSFKLAS